jgi:tripartite ATP-independent transporter DctP family solute receptor
MKKSRTVLALAVIFVVGVFFYAGTAGAQQAKAGEIAFGHGFMLETPHHKASLRFKEIIEQKSGGKLKVNVFPAGQLGSAKDMFESMQMGSQQIALLPTARISGFNPKLQLLDLPFLFPDRETAYKIFDGPFGSELLKTLDRNKILGVAFYEDGFKHFTCSKPIARPEDFKGTKFRTMESPIIMQQFKSLGANPTPIDFGELYNALQQKVVDGQENPLVTIFNMKFYEVQKYLILSSHAYLGHVLMYSKTWFDALPKDQQKILVDTGRELAPWQRNGVVEGEAGYLKKIKEFGTQVTEFSDAEKARMREATRPVYQVAEGIIGKDLIDRAQKEIEGLKKK